MQSSLAWALTSSFASTSLPHHEQMPDVTLYCASSLLCLAFFTKTTLFMKSPIVADEFEQVIRDLLYSPETFSQFLFTLRALCYPQAV
jgi:hypothetical protein